MGILIHFGSNLRPVFSSVGKTSIFAPQQDMSRQRRGRGLPLKALAQNREMSRDVAHKTADASTGMTQDIQ